METFENRTCNLVAILGPTATGKTAIAAKLAADIDGEIISADSRQVYRGMDLGTGKDLDEYYIDQRPIPYHLIDIIDAGSQYNVFEYQTDFLKVFQDIRQRKHFPVVCGGSGMYLEAILRGDRLIQVPPNNQLRQKLQGYTLLQLEKILRSYKTQLHNVTDVENIKRAIRAIEIEDYCAKHPEMQRTSTGVSGLIVGIQVDRNVRRERITRRLKDRLSNGMVGEVDNLMKKGVSAENLIYYGLEYKYITLYLLHQLSYDEMFNQLNIAIHQFAKRQMTWFRGMERRGFVIHWIDGMLSLDEKVGQIKQLMEQYVEKK